MKTLMILAPLVIGLIAAIGTVALIGAFMPREHVATVSVKFDKPPETVWALIADPDSQPTWRGGLKAIERLPDREGRRVWKERGGPGDGMTLELVESDPPRKLVTRIADDALPFGGTWTWEITPEGAGCRVRVTERGFIKPAPFRYIARVMGYDATMKGILKGLAGHLGQDAAFEK